MKYWNDSLGMRVGIPASTIVGLFALYKYALKNGGVRKLLERIAHLSKRFDTAKKFVLAAGVGGGLVYTLIELKRKADRDLVTFFTTVKDRVLRAANSQRCQLKISEMERRAE